MRKEQMWREHFERDIKQSLNDLEEKRSKIIENKNKIKPTMLVYTIFITVFVSIMYLVSKKEEKSEKETYFILAAFIMFFIVVTILYSKISRISYETKNSPYQNLSSEDREKFKQLIIKKIIKLYDIEGIYHPNELISKEIVESTKLFGLFNTFKGEDYVGLTVYNKKQNTTTKLQFCELELYNLIKNEQKNVNILDEYVYAVAELKSKKLEQYKSIIDERKNYTKMNYFKGYFFILDFEKNFNNELYLNGQKRPNMKLQDVEFDKMFKVHATNQAQAKHILTPDLRENFKKLYTTMPNTTKISAVFLENKLYLAISNPIDYLELDIKKSLVQFETIKKYYTQIDNLVNVANTLNLNENIWDNYLDN